MAISELMDLNSKAVVDTALNAQQTTHDLIQKAAAAGHERRQGMLDAALAQTLKRYNETEPEEAMSIVKTLTGQDTAQASLPVSIANLLTALKSLPGG